MDLTMPEKYDFIKKEILKEKSKNPIQIVKKLMHQDFINIHGPEHHFLDGAAFMIALHNSGMEFDLEEKLDLLTERTIKMPGAMCGYWGMCGSVASVGAVLAVLDGTGPLSDDEFYKSHMEFTSSVISKMSKIGGPRCCKRDAMIAFKNGVDYVKAHYDVTLQYEQMKCEFTELNEQCIKDRCPFYAHSFQQEY